MLQTRRALHERSHPGQPANGTTVKMTRATSHPNSDDWVADRDGDEVTRPRTPETYRKMLVSLRSRLRGDVTRLVDTALNGQPIRATSSPNQVADLASDHFDQDLTLSLMGSARGVLEQVDAALGRIEDGSYGQCEDCGVQIPAARLEALPFTALCVNCASRQEQRGRR